MLNYHNLESDFISDILKFMARVNEAFELELKFLLFAISDFSVSFFLFFIFLFIVVSSPSFRLNSLLCSSSAMMRRMTTFAHSDKIIYGVVEFVSILVMGNKIEASKNMFIIPSCGGMSTNSIASFLSTPLTGITVTHKN